MENQADTKTCKKCLVVYPATVEFFVAHKQCRNGMEPTCRVCARKNSLEWAKNNKMRVCENGKKYRATSVEHRKNYAKAYNIQAKLDVFRHYSNGVPHCVCCKMDIFEFLVIDHIDGGGHKHRQSIGNKIHPWLRANGYPVGYRVLCHNCNASLGLFGYCPHNTKINARLYLPLEIL